MLISAAAIIGVKFGGWGINLEKTNIKINVRGKICDFKFFNEKYSYKNIHNYT